MPGPIAPIKLRRRLPRPETFAEPDARYRGDHASVSLSDLAGDDAAPLRELYDFLLHVHDRLRDALAADGDDRLPAEVAAIANGDGSRRAAAIAHHLGARPGQAMPSLAVRQAIHDLRGGSLAGLIIHLDLIRDGLMPAEEGGRIFLLARDHLKIMRNAVHDLDPQRHAADLATKRHAVGLLREKWNGVTFGGGDDAVRVRFYSEWSGAVAERCMEFAALDRVLYNLVNNAARFAPDGVVDVYLRRATEPDEVPENLQLVVANHVTSAHAAALRERFGDDLSGLFQGGFTTGGQGLGMRIVADFVSHGYGLRKLKRTVAEGYCGAQLEGETFVAWFHWPAA